MALNKRFPNNGEPLVQDKSPYSCSRMPLLIYSSTDIQNLLRGGRQVETVLLELITEPAQLLVVSDRNRSGIGVALDLAWGYWT